MPLINLQTNLKSLKYGDDRPGGADSGQPFLFTGFNIPNVDFSYNQNIEQAYSGSAGFGIGQNFFDLPPITINAPTFGYTPGINSTSFTLFNGNGVDIATPIVKSLDATAKFITNGAEGAINAVIGAINNSFDTTRNPSSPDFLWRKNRFNIAHSFADTVRVTKFLTTPSGIFFIIKQELLERQNVKVDGYTRLYNPGSTIAQVGVNSIGYHLNKAGINPFERSYFKGGNIGYFDNARLYKNRFGIPNQPDTIGRGSNRLTLLTLSKINQENVVQVALAANNQYGVTPPESVDLLKYGGGPGSILGIGDTNIRWQNPTRKVKLREDKTHFASYNTNINSYNYLTPVFAFNGPDVYWYYNPLNSTDELGYRSVYSKSILKLKPKDSSLSKFFTEYFGSFNYSTNILNRNTKVISSSLYAPASSSAAIIRQGTNPNYPEYYTPLGHVGPSKWEYKPGGVSTKYEQALRLKYILVNTSSLVYDDATKPKGEEAFINSNTRLFDSKNNQDKDLFTLDGAQIIKKESLGIGQNTTFGNTGITDFRSGSFLDKDKKPIIPSTDYTVFNRDVTYTTSKTSFKGNWAADPNNGVLERRVINPNEGISSDAVSENNDVINFGFKIISPNKTSDINFRAYLDNWSDGFKGDWTPIKYMGRAENFYKYNGFSREGSITFLVPTLSRLDLKNNYNKLNQLIYSVTPSYSQGSTGTTAGLMRGSITRIYMGDYFDGVPAIIKNVDYQEIEGMGWDIDRDQEGKKTGDNLQLPKGIKVMVGFTVIHDFTPQFGETFIGYY